MVRKIIRTLEILQLDFSGLGWVLEAKIGCRHLAAGFPVPDLNGVLGHAAKVLGGDDISDRIRALAVGNPDLPVNLLGSKSQVIAFNAADHTAAKVFDVNDIAHQFVVGVRQQQICRRQRSLIGIL